MKKLIALFMTLCVSVAIVGCGDAKKEEKKPAGGGAAPPAKAPEKPEESK